MINDKGRIIQSELFLVDQALGPKFGKSVFFDSSTGTSSKYGDDQIKKFKYLVISGGETVKEEMEDIYNK